MGLMTVRMVPAGSCSQMSELIPATYNVSLLKYANLLPRGAGARQVELEHLAGLEEDVERPPCPRNATSRRTPHFSTIGNIPLYPGVAIPWCSGSQGIVNSAEFGAPGSVRTADPRIQKSMLHPAELRAHRVAEIVRSKNE
jgi:hypothetical protein